MSGTKDTTELVDLVIDAVKDGVELAKDPTNYVKDTSMLLTLLPELQAAVEGISNLPGELASMSAEDAAALVAHISAKLSVADPHAEQIIDQALKTAASVYGLVKAIAAPSAPVEAPPST